MSLPQEQDRTKALLELLYHVSREVATALDLRTVLQRVLYEAIQNVGGERCSIVVLDDAGKAVDATIVYGTAGASNIPPSSCAIPWNAAWQAG